MTLDPHKGMFLPYDRSNRDLLERINRSRRIFLSSTMIDGRMTLWACVLCHRTHRDRIEEAIEIIRCEVVPIAG